MKDMKNKALVLLVACFIICSCTNKELGMLEGIDNDDLARIEFDWQDIAPEAIPTSEGMRVNIFSTDHQVRDYGVDDISYTGGTVHLIKKAAYTTLAYSYQGNNIYFRYESNLDLIEAYCNTQTRTTYTRTFPDQVTYSQPQGLFYTGKHPRYISGTGEIISIAPKSRLYTYTFEVRNVKGAEFIKETRGAISGMAKSYYIGQSQTNVTPATILFNAAVDKANRKITGSFNTFGRLNAENDFTIEILYPSNTDGIAQYTWDVTEQINQSGHYTIIIDQSDIVIPDEGGEAASGWKVDVDNWNDQFVPLN